MRVRAIQDYEGQPYVFIDGTETGFPMEQAILEKKGESGAKTAPIVPRLPLEMTPSAPNMRREVFALDEGDVVLTFPANLSVASYDDLEAYVGVFLKKAKRLATALRRPAGEAQKPDWADKTFRSGDTVPSSTPFRIHHVGHGGSLMLHPKDGEKFPACDKCDVTYTLA